MLNDPTTYCRVCGLQQPVAQYGEDGVSPSYDFCDCCGVEFGYGDATLLGILNHRRQWAATGHKWHDPSKEPTGWSFEDQEVQIAARYRTDSESA